MDCLLGIDIGTTGTKSALFTVNGEFVDSNYESYPITYPGEDRAEQDPEDWWNALVATVRAVVSGNDGNTVMAMSLSTQGGCLVLLDDNFRPVCNAVSWLDTRAREISGLILKEISEDELYKTCGWPSVNGMNLATIVWFKEKMPEIYNRARYFCSTVEYINFKLSGTFAIDITNLALTAFLDLTTLSWSEKALSIAGITHSHVADIIPSGTCIGKLKPSIADELGLPKDVVLVSGAHDQYCANIGAGAVNIGDCVLSTGTAWVLNVTAGRMVFNDNRTIHPCAHVIDNKYGLMTAVSSGGISLNWFRDTFCPELNFEALSREAEKAEAGCGGLMFIPKNVFRNKKASFVNIDTRHTIGHFIRAVFEGVAFANNRHLEDFSQAGIPIEKIIMIGGGAGSSVWPRIVADISHIPITVPEQKEAACAGAAMLAGAGCGMFSSVEEASGRFSSNSKLVEPDKQKAAMYKALFEEFKNV